MNRSLAVAALPEDPLGEPLLEIFDLSLLHKGRKVLQDVTVKVHAGEIVGLLGPNGAGKTTLSSVLSGKLKPQSGTIVLNGVDVTRESRRRRSREGLTVCVAGHKRPALVQLADAILRGSKVLCLDEPFDGCDPSSSVPPVIIAILERLKEDGCGILILDHRVRELLDIVDRAYLICEGKILREGTPGFLMD